MGGGRATANQPSLKALLQYQLFYALPSPLLDNDDVGFTPESGHSPALTRCPLWANSGHRVWHHANKNPGTLTGALLSEQCAMPALSTGKADTSLRIHLPDSLTQVVRVHNRYDLDFGVKI